MIRITSNIVQYQYTCECPLTRSPFRRLLFPSWHFLTRSSRSSLCPGEISMQSNKLVHAERATLFCSQSRLLLSSYYKIQSQKTLPGQCRCQSNSSSFTVPRSYRADCLLLFFPFRSTKAIGRRPSDRCQSGSESTLYK